jgi:hypothetical protein
LGRNHTSFINRYRLVGIDVWRGKKFEKSEVIVIRSISAALASRPRVGCPGYARVGGQMGGDWLRSDDALGDAHAEKNPEGFNKKYSTIDWSGSTR